MPASRSGGQPESVLPLKPADFQILLVLLEGELHGYGLIKAVAEQSGGRVRLEVGSLYRLIARMSDEGLIAPAGRGRTADGKRLYRITRFGREVARLEAMRLAEVLRTAQDHGLVRR